MCLARLDWAGRRGGWMRRWGRRCCRRWRWRRRRGWSGIGQLDRRALTVYIHLECLESPAIGALFPYHENVSAPFGTRDRNAEVHVSVGVAVIEISRRQPTDVNGSTDFCRKGSRFVRALDGHFVRIRIAKHRVNHREQAEYEQAQAQNDRQHHHRHHDLPVVEPALAARGRGKRRRGGDGRRAHRRTT
jgi:hypothetical protein